MNKPLKLLFACTLLLGVTGCKEDSKPSKEPKFISNCSFSQKDKDGWIESVCVDRLITDNSIIAVAFNGDNIDFKQIEGNMINITDSTGKVISQGDPSSPSYLYDPKIRDEFKALNYELEGFKKDTITEEDLKNVDLKYISKANVVKLYNEASKLSRPRGPYRSIGSFTDVVILPMNEKQSIQIGYVSSNGYIDDINLKLIDSSMVEPTFQKVNENLDAIEKQIIEKDDHRFDASKLPHQDVLKAMNIEQIQEQLNGFFIREEPKK